MEQYIWVDNEERLREARQAICAARRLSLDTEYDSFRYFRDKLCLIQIRAGTTTFLLDPLSPLDISFLAKPLADPNVLLITHAGDNDIRLLKRDYGFSFCNLFDTYRAAMILGFQYLSLSRLVKHFLGFEMDKTKKLQRSRWDIRPLEKEQLKYAALDVRHLEELYEKLKISLEERGLIKEALQAFAQIVEVTWQDKIIDDRGYLRVRGCKELTAHERVRLKKLFLWRFAKAGEINRSPFMILSDDTLLKLSRLNNVTADNLASLGLLPRDKAREYGPQILAILNQKEEAVGDEVL